jgi:hypothetical protein
MYDLIKVEMFPLNTKFSSKLYAFLGEEDENLHG